MGFARSFRRQMNRRKEVTAKKRRRALLEPLEPRILLSADFVPGAADALADGLDQLGDRIDEVLTSEDLYDTRLPFIVQTEQVGEDLQNVAPTLGSLFSVAVDTNNDDAINGNETQLIPLDTDPDGTVDVGEFIQGWLFQEIQDELAGYSGTTADFASWLVDLEDTLTLTRPDGSGITLTLEVTSATDLTESVPNADLVFDVDFEFTVSQYLVIDLGTEADALKLLYYTGPFESKTSPVIPVDTKMEFGFTFGVRTGGQDSPGEELDAEDFFVRKADDLYISAESLGNAGVGFNLNIGFLGARVSGGEIDFQAAVSTLLIDPDSPAVLGFTTDQYGVEQTSGVVTGFDTIPSEDLAHGAGFVLRIGNAGIATQVDVLVDDTNDNLNDLVDDVNSAIDAAGLGDLVEASLDGSDRLEFTLVATTDIPLGFDNESWSDTGELSADPGAFEFTSDISFLLSVDGVLPKLVTLGFPDTAQTELGFDDTQNAALPNLVGQNNANASGTIGGDNTATFSVRVTQNNGTVTGPFAVNVTEALQAPGTNGSIAHLINDITTALTTAGLNSLILAVVDGAKIALAPADGTISAIEITAADTETENAIGFVAGQSSFLALTAVDTPISSFDLSEDAHLKLTIATSDGNANVEVTIPADLNADAAALADDINSAIDTALTTLDNKIDVAVDASGKFVLKATDSTVRSFSISTINTTIDDLVDDLNRALDAAGLSGLVTASAVDADTIQLATSGGETLEITKTLTFDAGVTHDELLNTATQDLFASEVDESASNIALDLPVHIIAGLNYTPDDVALVANFSPFGQLVIDPPDTPVAQIGSAEPRFDLNFTYTPSIDNQDTPVGAVPDSSTLTEEFRLVNMAEPLNFNLVTAESMVGLIMGLGTSLQQIANSGLFASFDIPFADAALSDLLNFSDPDTLIFSGLIDRSLIYETGGNGIDEVGVVDPAPNDEDRLLKRIEVEDEAYLIPDFVTAQDMADTLHTILGVALSGAGGINANYNPLYTLAAIISAVSDGILSDQATFDISIDTGGGPATTAIAVAADGTNTNVSDLAADIDDQLILAGLPIEAVAINGMIFLRALNASVVGFSITAANSVAQNEIGLIPNREATRNELTYQIELISEGRTIKTLDAPFAYDVDLSPFAKLTLDTTAAAEAQEVALQGHTGLSMTFGIDLSPPGNVIYDDTELWELNGQSGVGIKYERAITGNVPIYQVPPATPGDPPLPPIYHLNDDAVFSISIDGGTPVEVTILESATLNRSINDLVADINNALVTAGIGDDIRADYNGASGNYFLVLTATDSSTQFTITAANGEANSSLGFTAGSIANQIDFIIYDSGGGMHEITLDSLSYDSSVLDLIALINAQIAGGAVEAGYNLTKTGLRLVDTIEGGEAFRVEPINGSDALLTLGLFRADNTGTEYEEDNGDPYLIEGGQIGLTHLDDRFFVRDADLWGGLGLQTPEMSLAHPDGGNPGSALFGIVGVDTNLKGEMYAEVTAQLKDPDTGIAGGQVTLLELFEGAKQGRLSDDATFTIDIAGDGHGPYSITINKSDTLDDPATKDINEANNSLADLVALINLALEAEGIDNQIEAQTSGTRIVFVGKNVTVPAFTINASGTAISELGLPDSDTSSTPDENGIQTIAARAASRYAVADPVVSKLSELAYDNQVELPGFVEFAEGSILIGDTSGARAIVMAVDDTGTTGILTLAHTRGTFDDNELIYQLLPTAFALASANGTVAQNTSFGEFNLHIDVQDGFAKEISAVPTGFGDDFALLDGRSYVVGFDITDFGNPYDPDPPEATFDDLPGDTGDLYVFKDLGYSDIGAAYEDLLGVLEDVNEQFSFLNEPLPAIGKSVSELLNLVDGFEFGLQNLDEILAAANLALDPEGTDLPALTLQDIPNALRGAFGLPEGVNPDDSGAVDWVRLDFDQANNMLLVDMSLNEAISTKLGLDINVGSGLANLTSAGVLIVEGSLDINLSFGIDLTAPTEAYLFDDTSISGNLHIVGEGQEYAGGEDGLGLVFRASLGALSVFIQDGDALIDVDFELPGLDFSGEAVPGQKLIRNVVWDDWNTPVTTSDVEIVLPMFYGGEGPNDYIGDFSAIGDLGGLTVDVPDFSGILADIELGVLAYDPFDNILLAIDTLNLYLEGLSDILADEVLGLKMPFIGDQLADILFIESFRSTLYSNLKNGIENDIDPTPDDVTGLIEDLLGITVSPTSNMAGDYQTWFHQWNFILSGEKNITLSDFNLGIPNLGFDMDVSVDVFMYWELDLGFGVNFDEVAYIDVSDSNEIDIDLTISIQDGPGTLGFLQVDVTGSGDTGAVLNFDVNVENGNGGGNYLGFSDIGSINPVAEVTGNSLSSASDGDGDGDPDMLTLHLVTEARYGLPQLAADLVIDWALPADTAVNLLEGNAVLPPDTLGIGVDYIALFDMEFDSGSVARSLLEPLFGTVLQYIEPFMPVVDTLTAPIPILSDLSGEPFTLLDLAAIFGDVNPDFIDAVADILDVISIISDSMATNILPLGNMVLFDGGGGISNFDPFDPDSKLSEIDLTSLTTNADGDGLTVPLGGTEGTFDYTDPNNEFLKLVRSDPPLVKGLSMPIFTDPLQGIGLFLDQNAIMVDYKLPPLAVGFEYLQVFPVWGPLAVSIEISFGFTVDLHSVGFDTYGYQRYADGGFRNPEVMFDGFYLNDLDAEGVDAPEVLLEFGLVGAAELNLGIARAGVGGGINAQIYFDWFDPIADGRVHISELIANVISADPGPNPLAVFDLGGALTFQLFAFLEISLLGIEEEFPITPETELFSFEYTFDHDPILANDIGDGVLQLNMGPSAEDRIYGNTSDGHENITVEYDGGTVYVYSGAFGVAKGSLVNQFTGITHIVGIGDQGNDSIELILGNSGITYELEGGLGDDTITVSGGGGGTIRGGVGNDTLTGGAGDDIVWGEEGNDVIDGGGGYDILFGDQGRYFDLVSDPDPLITSRITGSDGDDTISGGTEDDIIIGAGGDDTLSGDGGNDVIIGDGGRFAYIDVGGHFEISAVLPDSYINYTPPGINTYIDPDTISDEIDEIHDDILEIFHATDLGFGGNDDIFGGEGGDLIFGGTADDNISGDAGNDIIFGGKGFDDISGGANDDTIFGGDQADTISGNENDDVISGGTGNDYIHGNEGDDVMKGDSGADVMFGDAGDDLVFGLTEPDVLMGGVDDDLVVGGTGSDVMFGDDGVVAKLDPSDGTGSKVIYNTLAFAEAIINALLSDALVEEGHYYDDDIRTVDLIQTYLVAGDGNDYLSGNAGDDLMFGGGGNDAMGGDVDPRLATFDRPTEISEDVLIGDGGRITFDQRRYRSIATVIGDTTGSPFNDIIFGDNGNDYILGGRGDDILAGGHGPNRGATDAAASDNDVIIGDNGELIFSDDAIAENFGRLEQIRTTDIHDNTGGADTAYGEEGADVILGGVNNDDGLGEPEVDRLYGDYYDYTSAVPAITIGNDVILGDNGLLDFASGSDTDLDTLDFIHAEPYAVTDWTTDPPTLDDTTILGGTDIIHGSVGYDVLIGGVGGDEMYGDDETASNAADDGEDIMLGDNADIFLIGNVGRLLVQVTDMAAGTAIDLITTTDTEDATGGADTMSGNARADIMLGGVNHGGEDTMYGDRGGLDPEDQPTPASTLNDGDDILLGDNGLLDFTFEGDESDLDRETLDLIRSFEDGLGGVDTISGNKGLDVAIGGTAGDTIYGDDANFSATEYDLADLLLGDNADIFLVPRGTASGGDIKLVLPLALVTDAAVKTIRTTDEEHPEYGGADTISGNAKGDIIAGGVYGDTLYGDRASEETSQVYDGNDIILGDNGAFEWQSDGRLVEIGDIDINANNSNLWNHFNGDTGQADTDLTTLDLVTTEQPNSGGRDRIYGDEGKDMVFGGTDSDEIYGDDGLVIPEGTGTATNDDLLFGDHGRLYPQFSTLRTPGHTWEDYFHSRNFFAIDIGDADGGEGDRMWGEEGDDTMVGQQGDDRMWGGSGDDDMTGGHNVAGGFDELSIPAIDADLNPAIPDPSIAAVNDLMDGGTGDDSMAGDNAIIWRRGDDLSPRFRELTEDSIYTTTADTITTNIDSNWQSDPDDAIGRDIELVDHSDAIQADPQGRFGADIMTGGADSDVMFGELANDLMQGDGAIESVPGIPHTVPGYPPFISQQIDMTDTGTPDTSETLYFNIPELASDADDYMEGNGGSDLMYGGLGQDDIIGGSSELFGLITEQMRPDASDYIFGGAGIAIERNDIGATTFGLASVDSETNVITTEPDGHARDADFIMGDNANVFRLVDESTDAFLDFNYDDIYGLQIIPRAMEQLDYTLGGADYNEGVYVNGAAQLTGFPADNGAADLIHGESGDDIIFGMTGSDVIFGEGQNDDIIGGYGHDWVSGGTGQDGVLGDDGLILTSRNSVEGEPLNGIEGLLDDDQSTKYNNGNALDETIKTPGEIQYAVINVTGQLKKTVDLVPFSYDPNWIANDDEFPDNQDAFPYADDIIFGGLGSDWLHGGSGDDAISGAEALAEAYVPVFDINGDPIGVHNLGYNQAVQPANLNNMNPGNVLAFNPEDVDGRHLNNRFRPGEFFLYDEYDPLRKILLNPDGTLNKDNTGVEFLLNFDETEGVVRPAGEVPKATGQQTETYPEVNDDGKDAIFGDLGNDWLVGGSGRDNIYGGWGNDLINADDDQTTLGDAPKHGDPEVEGANDVPDTHPYYEDRAYGGAGRDILIGNTGGDRLIDWVGEYNSYLVPYAPFGQASVSRTLMPHLQEFLYALSAGDGADYTRFADAIGGDEPEPTNNNPIPSRNGEPHGELGLVLQKDFAWQDQTGAPADPQAGNIPGGPRDVLRSAGFNDGTMEGFFVDSGDWAVENSVLKVSAASPGQDAAAVFHVDEMLPSYFEIQASITMEKPTGGWKANSYVIFDYYGPEDFKFAGLNASIDKIQMGHRDETGWHVDVQDNMKIKPGIFYNMLVAVNGTNVTVVVNNQEFFSHTFAPRVDDDGWVYGISDGMVGFGSDNSRGLYDNIAVKVLPPAITLEATEEFPNTDGAIDFAPQSGLWNDNNGRYEGAPINGNALAISLLDLGIDHGLAVASVLELEAVVNTQTNGGVVFDYYGADSFKIAAIDAQANQILIGHYTQNNGWVTDAAFDVAIEAGVDYTLNLSLKGTTVTAAVKEVGVQNWQGMVGHVFNAVTVDGKFGLLSKGGVSSFDEVTVKTNDPAFQDPDDVLFLTAASSPADMAGAVSDLTYDDLDPIIDAAINRWTGSSLFDESMLNRLDGVTFLIADLTGDALALAVNDTVIIDVDAAGHGWFVDDTPYQDAEYMPQGNDETLEAKETGPANGDVDLLTVMMHELGHVFGYQDINPETNDAEIMNETLDEGVRYLPEGTFTEQTHDNSDNLISMDMTPDESETDEALSSLISDNSWLVKYLVNGASKETDPNGDIAVIIEDEEPPDTGGDNEDEALSNPGKGKGKNK